MAVGQQGMGGAQVGGADRTEGPAQGGADLAGLHQSGQAIRSSCRRIGSAVGARKGGAGAVESVRNGPSLPVGRIPPLAGIATSSVELAAHIEIAILHRLHAQAAQAGTPQLLLHLLGAEGGLQ